MLRAWDTRSGKLALTVDEFRTSGNGDRRGPNAASVSADGDRIAVLHSAKSASSHERTHHLSLWDLRTNVPKRLQLVDDQRQRAVSVSRDGSLVATLGGSRQITVRSFSSGRVLSQFHPDSVRTASCLSFGQAGTTLAAAGASGPVIILDARTGEVSRVVNGPVGFTRAIAPIQNEFRRLSGGFSHSGQRDRDTGRLIHDPLVICQIASNSRS